MGRLTELVEAGFDMSEKDPDDDNYISVKCSSCAALVINGVPSHETGCPNKVVYHDCFICGYPVKVGEACDCDDPCDDLELELED